MLPTLTPAIFSTFAIGSSGPVHAPDILNIKHLGVRVHGRTRRRNIGGTDEARVSIGVGSVRVGLVQVAVAVVLVLVVGSIIIISAVVDVSQVEVRRCGFIVAATPLALFGCVDIRLMASYVGPHPGAIRPFPLNTEDTAEAMATDSAEKATEAAAEAAAAAEEEEGAVGWTAQGNTFCYPERCLPPIRSAVARELVVPCTLHEFFQVPLW